MILHLGNKLQNKGYTPTCVDTMAQRFGHRSDWKSGADACNTLVRALRSVGMVLKFRKQIKYLLLDTYSTKNFWLTYVLASLSKRLNIPYIPILHGGNLPQRFQSQPKAVKKIFQAAHALVSPSLYLKHFFEQQGFALHYIPNAIEKEAYPQLEPRFDTPRLLYLRALHEIYNPSMAIEALQLLKKDFPSVQLHMVGPNKDNSLEKCQALVAKNKLEDEVFFYGKLDKEEWLKVAQQCNVFINPTRFDNMPVSLVEAMCLGLPIVSTNVGGIPFLIESGKEGILVASEEPQAMAEGIKKYFAQPQFRSDIVDNARKKAEKFSWDTVKKQWFKILEIDD